MEAKVTLVKKIIFLFSLTSIAILGYLGGYYLPMFSIKNRNIEKSDIVFYDGHLFTNMQNYFDYMDTNGFSISGLQFAYEDYLKSEIPEGLKRYRNLNALDVFRGQVSSIPDWVFDLNGIRHLQMSDQNLTTIPDQICKLTGLKTLIIGNNHLSSLPNQIGCLSSLKNLQLFHNNLTRIPESIGNLKNLENIDLSSNSLSDLPITIKELRNLQFLYLGGNNFSESKKKDIQNLLPNTKIYF